MGGVMTKLKTWLERWFPNKKPKLPQGILPPPKPDERDWQGEFQRGMSEGYHSSGKVRPIK